METNTCSLSFWGGGKSLIAVWSSAAMHFRRLALKPKLSDVIKLLVNKVLIAVSLAVPSG